MGIPHKISPEGTNMRNIREEDPQWVRCDKDSARRMMEDGEIVKTIRFHCAATAHHPIVYQHRVSEKAMMNPKFQPPTCPYCNKTCVEGGADDFEGIALKGPM